MSFDCLSVNVGSAPTFDVVQAGSSEKIEPAKFNIRPVKPIAEFSRDWNESEVVQGRDQKKLVIVGAGAGTYSQALSSLFHGVPLTLLSP